MKTHLLLQALKTKCVGIAAILLAATGSTVHAAGPKAFQFQANGSNTSGSTTTLDHPALNGKPKLNLILTQRYSGNYNNHPVGLDYNYSTNKWMVRNEDLVATPLGSGFNVLLSPGTKRIPVSPLTTNGYISYFTFQKNKPNQRLLATHVVNPGKTFSGVKLTDPFSLYYYNGLWSVYTDNFENMKAVAFNVADVTKLKSGGAPASFLFTSNAGNISSNLARIDNPLTNGNPNAVVFASHVWSNTSPNYMTKQLGVYYDGSQWGVFTQDNSAMPVNEAFFVAVVAAPTP